MAKWAASWEKSGYSIGSGEPASASVAGLDAPSTGDQEVVG